MALPAVFWREEKLLLMFVRFPLRLTSCVENCLRPTQKELPFRVTFPLSRSSVKMAVEQAKLVKTGPIFEHVARPLL
jgi:hypothetical protein